MLECRPLATLLLSLGAGKTECGFVQAGKLTGMQSALWRLLLPQSLHVQISKFKSDLFPTGSDPLIGALREDKDARRRLVEKASAITIDLPSQFLDKADFFSEATSSSLANAFSQVNRLKQFVGLLGDLADKETQEVIDLHLMTALKQINEAEEAAKAAFQALLAVGRSSR